MTVLGVWQGVSPGSPDEITQLARAALATGHAMIDLAKAPDAELATRIRIEAERQWGPIPISGVPTR